MQESISQEITGAREFEVTLSRQLQSHNTTMRNMAVSFMNTADEAVVVTVLENFQIQIVLYL